MTDVTAVILAAGFSRRMGSRNKLLLPLKDTVMIRHVVDVYSAITQRPVLVVTGYEAEAVKEALAGSSARTVFNAAYAAGQQTSVACGLRAAVSGTDVLIGLGDQPLLTVTDLRALIGLHNKSGGRHTSIPMHEGQRGNPIVVPASMRARILADPKAPGCKKFTRAHPEAVRFHALSAAGFYADIDTPEAYAALTQPCLEENP